MIKLSVYIFIESLTYLRSKSATGFLVCFRFSGDRIVKVNGESIIGKTYSQVIALIQNR